jgi:hypothetical protein
VLPRDSDTISVLQEETCLFGSLLKERKETVEWLNRGVRVVNVRICVPHQSSTRLDLSGTGFKGTV